MRQLIWKDLIFCSIIFIGRGSRMQQNILDIYHHLVKQYEHLDDEEKKAILIYKSKIFDFMNAITCVDHFEELSAAEIASRIPDLNKHLDKIEHFRKIVDLKENMMVKYTIFQGIHLDNPLQLIDDLKREYQILLQAKDKMMLQEDLVVYRGVSLEHLEDVSNLARGNIISTSIKIEDTEPFLFQKDINILYVIHLKKGTSLLVAPVSLVHTYKDHEDYLYHKLNGIEPNLLKLMNRGEEGCQEVILFKDSLNLLDIQTRKIEKEEGNLIIYTIDTEPVIQFRKNNVKG